MALQMTVLDDNLQAIAARFEDGIDELALTIVKRQRHEVPEHALEAPEIWEAIRGITRESRLHQVAHLRRGGRVPAECPSPDAEAARMAARGGVSAVSVHQAYQIAHDESWESWLDAIEHLEIDQEARRGCRQAISRFVKEYDQALAKLVIQEYERERRLAARTDHDRAALIRELLDRSRDDANGLGYDLDCEHLGVIASGRGARKTIDKLAKSLDRQLLVGELQDGIVMAWLGGPAPLGPRERDRLSSFKPPRGASLAVGNPAAGVDGFRRTHRQAGEAHIVALRTASALTFYSDVHLVAVAMRDESLAREFVINELDGLGGDDHRSRTLRETLRAYFATSQNATATASRLGVHEHTVSRHLKAVEEHIGQPVNERRAELEVALRLDALLSGSSE